MGLGAQPQSTGAQERRGGLEHRFPMYQGGLPKGGSRGAAVCEPIRKGWMGEEVRALCRCAQMQSPEQRLRKGLRVRAEGS